MAFLVPPELVSDILEEVSKRLPQFPIVLHGASSVIPKYVKIINDNGGNLADAVGIPEDQPVRLHALLSARSTSILTSALL